MVGLLCTRVPQRTLTAWRCTIHIRPHCTHSWSLWVWDHPWGRTAGNGPWMGLSPAAFALECNSNLCKYLKHEEISKCSWALYTAWNDFTARSCEYQKFYSTLTIIKNNNISSVSHHWRKTPAHCPATLDRPCCLNRTETKCMFYALF